MNSSPTPSDSAMGNADEINKLLPRLLLVLELGDDQLFAAPTSQQWLRDTRFREPAEMSDAALSLIIAQHLASAREANELHQPRPLYGGYVLVLNGSPVLFPQCCGETSDIHWWRNLARTGDQRGGEGHPAPNIKRVGDWLEFSELSPRDEVFSPPAKLPFRVRMQQLNKACDLVTPAINELQRRVEVLVPQLITDVPSAGIAEELVWPSQYFPNVGPFS